jgi:hypothetical protein
MVSRNSGRKLGIDGPKNGKRPNAGPQKSARAISYPFLPNVLEPTWGRTQRKVTVLRRRAELGPPTPTRARTRNRRKAWPIPSIPKPPLNIAIAVPQLLSGISVGFLRFHKSTKSQIPPAITGRPRIIISQARKVVPISDLPLERAWPPVPERKSILAP